MAFINQYEGEASLFAGIIPDSANTIICGGTSANTAGLFTKIDPFGHIVSNRKYTLPNNSFRFLNGVRCDNGEYLLYGYKVIGNKRNDSFIMRVDANGNTIWARSYKRDKTRYPIKLIKSVNDTYFFTTWYNISGTVDDLEVIKIDGQGNVLEARQVGTSADDQVASIIPYNDGCIVFGGTSAGPGWDSFIIAFDSKLNMLWAKLIGGSDYDYLLDIVRVDGDNFIFAGETNNQQRYSYLAPFSPTLTSIDVRRYDLSDGVDSGYKRMISAFGGYYNFGRGQNSSSGYVARFDQSLNLVWLKQIDLKDSYLLADCAPALSPDKLTFCGWTGNSSSQFKPLVVSSDPDFNSCITLSKQLVPVSPTTFSCKDWKPGVTVVNVIMSEELPVISGLELQKKTICPDTGIDLNQNPSFQSPYTYLQATGSDGSDGSAAGYHLRWSFLRKLGEAHLAKGNLSGSSGSYPTNIGFNKDNDFVRIYRSEYKKEYTVNANFSNAPDGLVETGPAREWRYKDQVPVPQVNTNLTTVVVRFMDTAQYDTIRSATDPAVSPLAFIQAYTGILEVQTENKLMMKGHFDLGGTTGTLKVESVSVQHDQFDAAENRTVSCRKTLSATDDATARTFVCENIGYFRLSYQGVYPSKITLSAYQDHVIGVNAQGGWEFVDQFALSLDNALVYKRLEDTARGVFIDKKWPKYNNDNATTGEFKVKVNNYIDRWISSDGLRTAVEDYLTLSQTDVKAEASLPSDGAPEDKAHLDISYLDMLNFVGLDFHVARMLGLGHIDVINKTTGAAVADAARPVRRETIVKETTVRNTRITEPVRTTNLTEATYTRPEREREIIPKVPVIEKPVVAVAAQAAPDTTLTDKYVYLLQYVTVASLEDNVPAQIVTHFYMSLPTSKLDHRLPPAPALDEVTYGLAINNGTGVSQFITDTNGYTPYEASRFININRQPFLYESPFGDFYASGTEYCTCEETLPVLFGVEYRSVGESTFVKPEINNDPNYYDYGGLPEVIPIPEKGSNPVYTHQEKEEGFHEYGLYSINWFSRVSPVSNVKPTDETKFPKRITLLPPANFAVQLIQEEEPLIFTTADEQQDLGLLPGPDKTFVRVTFDWNHVHNSAYQFADRANIFFRENEPAKVRGEVLSVTPEPGNKVRVQTKSFQVNSTTPVQTVQPFIAAGDEGRFEGSLFVSDGQPYLIDSIEVTGNNPVFILQKVKKTVSQEQPINSNNFISVDTYTSPSANEKFLVMENLADENNWDMQLQRSVYLEHFHTVYHVRIDQSTDNRNNRQYRIRAVAAVSGNTVLTLRENIPNPSALSGTSLLFPRTLRVIALDQFTKKFTVQGDVTGEIATGAKVRIKGSRGNDGEYTVVISLLNGSNTDIEVVEAIPDSRYNGYLVFEKTTVILSYNNSTKELTISGNHISQIIPPYYEQTTNDDGTLVDVVIGGVFATAAVTIVPDVYSPDNVPSGSNPGDPIPNSNSGVYKLSFDTYQLPDHIDPEVEWYKGFVRIKEDSSYLPPVGHPDHREAEMKLLNVWAIDNTGTTLQLIAFDSAWDPASAPSATNVPIKTTGSVDVNFHPSYKLYLTEDTGTGSIFNAAHILPAAGAGDKQTYMGIRSADSSDSDLVSYIPTPVVLLAQEIIEPEPPGTPAGPLFATRPDFYGKATYTFDVTVSNPYALIFYRANERKILDTLYHRDTVTAILNDLALLQSPDADFFVNRWSDLVNVVTDPDPGPYQYWFKEYTPGGYRFPIPDNPGYVIPNLNPGIQTKPFLNNTTPPGQGAMPDIVKEAIDGAFLPLTEQPLIYDYTWNETQRGGETSSRPPRIKDGNGNLLTGNNFDPFPMAMKLSNGNVRFTDYTLDGASKNFYFYYGKGMSNKLKISDDRSFIVGPIQLVNASPAEEPAIKKVITQLQNPVLGISTAVRFELNEYIASENIRKVEIYRATAPEDALTIRTMKLVKEIPVPGLISGEELLDDFSDVSFPLYGDPLHYRVVALREIINEQGVTELVPSKPSNTAFTNVVDVINPPAPQITANVTTVTATALQGVSLEWPTTCYNGRYYLYKMTSTGNWMKIYSIKTNDAIVSVDLADTDFAAADLDKQDDDGNTIYHRFRVQVENSSGLLNLTQNELTI